MKSTFILGLIAVSSAISVEPKRAAMPSPGQMYKDEQWERELKSTLDSLAQAEKEVGMKMDTPEKPQKSKYTGIGADTALANQAATEEKEDEDNTMASFEEAKKEASAYQSAEQIKQAKELDAQVKARMEEEKKKDANSK